MNSLPRPQLRRRPRLLPLARHPRRPRAARAPRRRASPCSRPPASTSSSSRRPASARATPAIVPFVDTSLYVMTPEYGAAVAAREDRHARLRRRRGDQQVRAPRRRGRAARRRPPAGPQPRGVRQAARRHAGLRHQRGDVQRRRRHRALPAPARAPRATRASPSTRACSSRVDVRHSSTDPPGRPGRAGPLPRRDHRDGPRLPRPHRRAGRAGPPGPAARARRRGAGRAASRAASPRCSSGRTPRRRHHAPSSSSGPSVVREYDEHPGRESLSGNRVPRVARPPLRRPRRAGALLAPREPARPLPVHRRRLPVQARERGPGPDVRRRGRPGPHQPPLQGALARASPRPGSRRRSTP